MALVAFERLTNGNCFFETIINSSFHVPCDLLGGYWGDHGWYRDDADDNRAKEAYDALLRIGLYESQSSLFDQFSRALKERAKADYGFDYDEANEKVGIISMSMHVKLRSCCNSKRVCTFWGRPRAEQWLNECVRMRVCVYESLRTFVRGGVCGYLRACQHECLRACEQWCVFCRDSTDIVYVFYFHWLLSFRFVIRLQTRNIHHQLFTKSFLAIIILNPNLSRIVTTG